MLILPNLSIYDEVLKEALNDESKKPDVDRVVAEILYGLDELVRYSTSARVNGVVDLAGQRQRLVEKVGGVLADKIVASERTAVAHIILETDLKL